MSRMRDMRKQKWSVRLAIFVLLSRRGVVNPKLFVWKHSLFMRGEATIEKILLRCDALQYIDSFVSQELIMLCYVHPSHDGRLVSFTYYVTRKFVVYFVRRMMSEKQ